jgi:hypothetical protein
MLPRKKRQYKPVILQPKSNFRVLVTQAEEKEAITALLKKGFKNPTQEQILKTLERQKRKLIISDTTTKLKELAKIELTRKLRRTPTPAEINRQVKEIARSVWRVGHAKK